MTDTGASPTLGARYRLRTFGTLALLGPANEVVLGSHGHHRRRLALLAVLAAAGEQGRSRDQLVALFWPEATQSRARHSLDQLLYALRSSISESLFVGADPVRLNDGVLSSDVATFNAALARGDPGAAIDSYRAPFLDGVHLGAAPEFERWLDGERSRLARRYAGALERMAERAEIAGDHREAVGWWRRMAEADALSDRNATGLIRALMRSGDHAAALQYAAQYEAIVAQELDTSAGPAIAELVAEVRAAARTGGPGAGGPPVHVPPTPMRPVSVLDDARPLPPRPAAASRARPASHVIGALILLTVLLVGSAALIRRTRPAARRGDRADASPAAAGVRNEVSGAARRPLTQNIAAYELYLRGRDPVHFRSNSDSGPLQGLAYLEQAVALDPHFAAAYAGMAHMYVALAAPAGLQQARELKRLADSTARRAVALDSTLPEAYTAVGKASLLGLSDLPAAEVALRRSIVLGESPNVHEYLSDLLLATGRPGEGLAEALRATQVDPLSASAAAEVGQALCVNRRYDEGIAQLRRVADVRPPLQRTPFLLGVCYSMKGMWPEAIAELRRSRDSRMRSMLGYALARSGAAGEATQIQAELREHWRQTGRGAFEVAVVSAGLHEFDQAFEWLDRSVDDLSLHAHIMYPLFADLQADPRFERFRRRLAAGTR